MYRRDNDLLLICYLAICLGFGIYYLLHGSILVIICGFFLGFTLNRARYRRMLTTYWNRLRYCRHTKVRVCLTSATPPIASSAQIFQMIPLYGRDSSLYELLERTVAHAYPEITYLEFADDPLAVEALLRNEDPCFRCTFWFSDIETAMAFALIHGDEVSTQ